VSLVVMRRMSNVDPLRSVLRAQIGPDEGAKKVTPPLTLRFGAASRGLEVREPVEYEVLVQANDLCPVLKAFLAGGRTATEVSEWASFILLHPAYIRPELEVDGSPFEVIWDVLHELLPALTCAALRAS
jgi:hypothetical protein